MKYSVLACLIKCGLGLIFVCAVQHCHASIAVTNTDAVLTFDLKGQVVSLRERATGRELLMQPTPMIRATLTDGKSVASESLVQETPECFKFKISQNSGMATIRITPFEGGWSFSVDELDIPEVKNISFLNFIVRCNRWRGQFAGLVSNQHAGIMIRPYDFSMHTALSGNRIHIYATSKANAVGKRFGMLGVARPRLTRAIQAMTVAAGVPVSFTGGGWSRDAEECRGSYLQPILEHAATEDWIDVARRGCFSTIHFRVWMETLGHYNAKTNLFPRGWVDLFDASDKIHAAGLRSGIHTLTGCINPHDPWIATDLNTNLLAWADYTLAADFAPDATELIVNEEPVAIHDTVFTYSGNGNAIRIGSEIIQYTGIKRTPPYAFTGVERGAFGTRIAAHKAGAQAAYLQQRYMAFYPEPDSPLGDVLADQIASLFHGGRFDQIYLDGAEGMGLVNRRHQHKMMRKILGGLNASPVVEASSWSQHNWWQHSRVGAWDSPYYDAKRFIDMHVPSVEWSREAEFLQAQMGWWSIRNPSAHFRGLFADENEYFSSRVAGMDASMSVTALNVNKKPLTLYRNKMLTIMGWYERFRLARAWAEGVQEQMNVERAEFRLRQDAAGLWTLAPVTTIIQRVKATIPGSESWQADFSQSGYSSFTADARVEVYYGPGDYTAKNALVLFDPTSEEGINLSNASNMTFKIQRGVDAAHGAVVKLHAKNSGAPQDNSWTRLERVFSPHANPGSRRGMGVWIKGDGSGAILDFQLNGPREYGKTVSDHFVKIDFTGWRYVDFVTREKEIEEALKWKWDPNSARGRFRRILNMSHIYSVAFMLNNIALNQEVNIEIAGARMFPTKGIKLERPVLVVNDKQHVLPFSMSSGDFAELENETWQHFNEAGTFLGAAENPEPLTIVPGNNVLGLIAQESDQYRAEVTLFVKDTPFPALHDNLDSSQQEQLAYEPDLDLVYAPKLGANGRGKLRLRPSGSATLEIEILGPIEKPMLTLGEAKVIFPVSLADGDRLFCRDTRNWRVINAERKELQKGELTAPVPQVSGITDISLSSENPDAAAYLKVVKLYSTK